MTLVKFFGPIVLILMMISMGMTLQVCDFKNIFKNPLPIFVGSLGQLILLPLLAFAIIHFWPFEISAPLKIGLIILAACPGGVGSNVVAYLAKGDAALSVTLTLISSFSAVVTIPFLINYSLKLYASIDSYVPLPILSTSIKVAAITIIPIFIGMICKKKLPNFTQKFSGFIQKASIFLLILLVVSVLYKEKQILIELTKQAGALGIALCAFALLIGFALAMIFKLNKAYARTIAIEVGLQNIFLAVIIATTFLNEPAYAIVPAVYSPITMIAALVIVLFFGDVKKVFSK